MNPIERLSSNKYSFTKSEKKIADYIMNNCMDVVQLSVVEIAQKSKSSKSAIIRLCQKIGYNGFSEFKFDLSRFLISNNQVKTSSNSENPIAAITSAYADYINMINTTLSYESVELMTNLILNSKKIKLFGYNRTGFSAYQFRYRLSKIGFDAEAINDTVLMNDSANSLCEDDLCIIFSIKASKSLYLNCVKVLSENKCKIVLITMTPRTCLKSYCDLVITLPYISKLSEVKFLDDQALFFVFIEIVLSELAKQSKKE